MTYIHLSMLPQGWQTEQHSSKYSLCPLLSNESLSRDLPLLAVQTEASSSMQLHLFVKYFSYTHARLCSLYFKSCPAVLPAVCLTVKLIFACI